MTHIEYVILICLDAVMHALLEIDHLDAPFEPKARLAAALSTLHNNLDKEGIEHD